MGALEISHFISKSGNPSNTLSTLYPQISVLLQPLDEFLIEGHFAKEKWKYVKLHIWVFPLYFSEGTGSIWLLWKAGHSQNDSLWWVHD